MPRPPVSILLGMLLAAGAPALAQGVARETDDGEPTIKERVWAQSHERALGLGAPRVRKVRWLDPVTRDPLARGLQVRVAGLDIERVRVRDAASARALARRLAQDGRADLVEARGREVLLLRGDAVQEPTFAKRARAAAWDLLPAAKTVGFFAGPGDDGGRTVIDVDAQRLQAKGRAPAVDPLEEEAQAATPLAQDEGITDLMRSALLGRPLPAARPEGR